jgi:exopolysaccharide biosynthesis protein
MRQKVSWLALLLTLSLVEASPAAPCPTEEAAAIVAPGLKHTVLCRGVAASTASYRIMIGVFDRQSEADHMLHRLHSNGISAALIADGERYRIVTPGLSTRAEADESRQRLIDLGHSPPLEIQEILQDLTNPAGPWIINVLEADPKKIQVQVAHAYDAAIGLETTAELATRREALAAINGGYFRMEGLLAGDSLGTLKIDGLLISEPDRGRAAVGFFARDGVIRSVFGRLSFRGELRLEGGDPVPLDGLNRHRKPSEIVLFTPRFHRTTLTPPGGTEIAIEEGRISEIRDGAGSTEIPPNGVVLSIGSERIPELSPHMKKGAVASVETKLLPLLPDPEGDWERAEFVLSGGPLLLWKGRRLEVPEKESISEVFFLARHPRTAVGARADGTLLFVTVDGRQPTVSVGMSIPELTDLMLELGCVSAINLDGGGSTTMVIGGQVVNKPSSFSGPRRNADAILLFPAS